MQKILCIGEALIDMICTDKGQSLSEGQHFLKRPGGAPTNVAAAIAALGGSVEIVAKVGNDPFGKQLREVLNEFNVSTQWLLTDDSHFTTMAFVSLLENGERDFVFSRGADGYLDKADIAAIDLREFSIVHFGSATAFLPGPLQAAYATLLERARQSDVLISFDPNYRHLLFPGTTRSFIDQAWHFLKAARFAKLSDEEALLITGCATVDEAARQLSQEYTAVLAITIGKKGALLINGGEIIPVPGVPSQVIDTTGAGDAFTGAVLYQLSHYTVPQIRELDMEQWKTIIRNGNKAGARTCEYLGAMEAFRHLSSDVFN
ncbi:MAG: carbohydrate kinase [Chitinophagaceae bacterium]